MILGGDYSDDEELIDAEQLYISACCARKVWEPALHGVDRSMFVMNTRAYDTVDNYVRSHGTTPPVDLLIRLYSNFERVDDLDPLWAAAKVLEAAQKRALLNVANDAITALGDNDPETAAAVMASARDHVPQTAVAAGTPLHDPDLFVPPDLTGRIPVPDDRLQSLTHGIGPGHYWVIAARLKQGKTWMLLRHALSALQAGYDVVFISLEMTKHQVAERMHTLILNSWATPETPAARQEAVSAWLARHEASMLLVDRSDHPMVTPTTVGRYCHPQRLVIVDYIGLMTPSGAPAKGDADWAVMQSISRELRRVTLSTGGALLSAAQLNRQAGKSPDVIHIAETDSIARDADVVVIMNRPENAPVSHCFLAAHRHGSSGDAWWTRFLPEVPDFSEISSVEAQRQVEHTKTKAGR